ncbi:unnamed protein product, partial [Onchocerca ochengi]|uniref:CUB domain-containing protein n=1 Tax=Onchocerca ochengi TaxID=42157 RepID=A0A182EU89_ONCOC
MNTTDGRVFINTTIITGNYGDGIHYREGYDTSWYHTISDNKKPRLDMCIEHKIPQNFFFPHLIQAKLTNGTVIDSNSASPCWMIISLPARLLYTYSIQFLAVTNENDENLDSETRLIICDANANFDGCDGERYRIPILNRILPQTISFRSTGQPIYLSLEHIPSGLSGQVAGDINLFFRIHASVI